MNDCSKHKKDVAGISDMKLLAEMIGDLHYESLYELLFCLQTKLYIDASKDHLAGRKELSSALFSASFNMQGTAKFINKAWEISKPFMTDKNQQQ